MFRQLTRQRLELSHEECIEILKKELRGVLAVLGDDAYPYAVPMNHFYNEEDGLIYFHSGKMGHKVDAMKNHDKVSFCVMDQGEKSDDWSYYFRSVIVFGRVEFIDDYKKILSISEKLCYTFTSDKAYIEKELKTSGPATLLFAIRPEHICGKRVHEA